MNNPLIKVSLLMLLILLFGGCAATPDIAKLQSSVEAAQTSADEAKAMAIEAQGTANRAISLVEEAMGKANGAQSTAERALTEAQQANEKAERMFQKSISK